MDEVMKTEAPRMPVVFVGHGSPMNAIADNRWSRAFHALGEQLPTPKAIVSVSAHWLTSGTLITDNEKPPTIHDFGGFPQVLFDVEYPALGDRMLAKPIAQLLDKGPEALSEDWGIDHGSWSVLKHIRPMADVPVLQVSIDPRKPAAWHMELGKSLAALRNEGVLIMASGNITHSLRDVAWRAGATDKSSLPWAGNFDRDIAKSLEQHDGAFLQNALDTPDGIRSHPTNDHYLPLLYAFGASGAEDSIGYPITGFDLGALSMRSVVFQ